MIQLRLCTPPKKEVNLVQTLLCVQPEWFAFFLLWRKLSFHSCCFVLQLPEDIKELKRIMVLFLVPIMFVLREHRVSFNLETELTGFSDKVIFFCAQIPPHAILISSVTVFCNF